MVEALVVLPVLIACFAALIFFFHLFSAKLEASRHARRCAWRHSLEGCDKSPPPRCRIKARDAPRSRLGRGDARASPDSSALKGLEGANRLALALLGLSQGIAAEPEIRAPRPLYFGGGTTAIRSRYTVMCNERNMEVLDVAIEAYCRLGRDRFLGCRDRKHP
jgi:hypothetical protein